MSHFAEIDDDGVVQRVIVAEQDFIDTLPNSEAWIQTSYNTRGGKHYAPNSQDEDDKPPLRKTYAGIGYIYDKTKDKFIAPQPYPSWVLDSNDDWQAPVAMPDDADKRYYWDEPSISWKENN